MDFLRRERLQLLEVPAMSPGAPMPQIVADDCSLVFGYVLREADVPTDGTTIHTRDAVDEEQCAIFTVPLCSCVKFGSPNDEAIGGHRLAGIGLKSYAAYEVLNSAWIDELERANRVHPHHRKERFQSLRHVVFTFHDRTLEFIAERFSAETRSGQMGRLVADALERAQRR